MGHCGRARRDAEFRQGIGHVAVHGVLADAQPLADGLIAETAGNQPQHLEFPAGQADRIHEHVTLRCRREPLADGVRGRELEPRVETRQLLARLLEFRQRRIRSPSRSSAVAS